MASTTSMVAPRPLVAGLTYDSYGAALKSLHSAVIGDGPCGNLGSRECALNHPPFLHFLREDAFEKLEGNEGRASFDLVQPIIPLASEESGLLKAMFVTDRGESILDFTSPLDEDFAITLSQWKAREKIEEAKRGSIRQLSKALKAASVVPLDVIDARLAGSTFKDIEESEALIFDVATKIELRKSRQWWQPLPTSTASMGSLQNRTECVRCHGAFEGSNQSEPLSTLFVVVFLRKISGESIPLIMRPSMAKIVEQSDAGIQGGIFSFERVNVDLTAVRSTVQFYASKFSKLDIDPVDVSLSDVGLLWNVSPANSACSACLNEYVDLCISDKGGQRSRREQGKMDERMDGVRESNIRITGSLELSSGAGVKVRGLFCHGRTFARMYKTAPKTLKRKGKEPISRSASVAPQKLRRSRTGGSVRGCVPMKREGSKSVQARRTRMKCFHDYAATSTVTQTVSTSVELDTTPSESSASKPLSRQASSAHEDSICSEFPSPRTTTPSWSGDQSTQAIGRLTNCDSFGTKEEGEDLIEEVDEENSCSLWKPFFAGGEGTEEVSHALEQWQDLSPEDVGPDRASMEGGDVLNWLPFDKLDAPDDTLALDSERREDALSFSALYDPGLDRMPHGDEAELRRLSSLSLNGYGELETPRGTTWYFGDPEFRWSTV